jgi:hypothetical protein
MRTRSNGRKAEVKAEPRVKIETKIKREGQKCGTVVKMEGIHESGVFSCSMPKLEVDFSPETNTTRRRRRRAVRNTAQRTRGRVRRAKEELQEQQAQRRRVTPTVQLFL